MQDTPLAESRFLGLHSKAFVVDGESVYVGSRNFDPRSTALNTELGMLVRSVGLAAKLKRISERDVLPGNAWRVRRDEGGALVRYAGQANSIRGWPISGTRRQRSS
jgi:putative cardiolipin synthase